MIVLNRMVGSLIIVGMLAGCVTSASTGILAAGPNTYAITERFILARGGSMEAQRVALAKANEFCRDRNREMSPIDLKELGNMSDPTGPRTGYNVTFRCLLATDPEFKR